MSRASRLARRSKAEEGHVRAFADERLRMVRAAGGDERTVPVSLMVIGVRMAADFEGTELIADELEQIARDLRARMEA